MNISDSSEYGEFSRPKTRGVRARDRARDRRAADFYHEGMSMVEIGRLLGVSTERIRQLLHRQRQDERWWADRGRRMAPWRMLP
jgi:transposase